MPTLFKMSDEKEVTEMPAAVVISATQEPKSKKTKKYAIIAVSAILAVAIILAAILVGVYMFSEAQKEIIKYSLDFNEKIKQDVVSDPNTNIVQYHVSSPGQDSWIVNDFNKDIQIVKIQTKEDTNCYLNALNRSNAMDPSQITKPDTTEVSGAKTLTYMTSNTPVSDTSFLPKAARDMCKGISIYWVYPHCPGKTDGRPPNGTDVPSRAKRDVDNSPYYYEFYTYYNGYYIPCFQGCCRTICACSIRYYANYYNGVMYCTWYYYNCPGYGIYSNPVYDYCSYGPRGLTCPNRYPTNPPTC